jgi:acetyl esterase/lipase
MDASGSTSDLTKQIFALGKVLTPEMNEATRNLLAPLHSRTPSADVTITSDERYGTHARHRLDVYQPKTGAANLPILLFVHGGGFTQGDKATPGTPFYGNIGIWAARNGVLGVMMTYRLAPEAQFPDGSDDVAAAVKWIRANAAKFGGDTSRLFVMGHSAGAGLVATYVADPKVHGPGGPGIAGALLTSGNYNTMAPGGPNPVYYGTDKARWPEMNALPGLVATKVPLMIATAELDPPRFETAALELLSEVTKARQQMPRFVRLSGHNHISFVQHIGTSDNVLGAEILDFIRTGR